jgi:hypothetical protein
MTASTRRREYYYDFLSDLLLFCKKSSLEGNLYDHVKKYLLIESVLWDYREQQFRSNGQWKLYNGNVYNGSANSLRELIKNSLSDLAIGSSIIAPFISNNHNVVIEFCKNSQGYDVVVYNTGAGLPFHHEAKKIGSKEPTKFHDGFSKYWYPLTYRGIREGQISALLDEMIKLELGSVKKDAAGNNVLTPPSNIADLYFLLQNTASSVCEIPPEDRPLLAYKRQSFASCQFSPLNAWIMQMFSSQKNGASIYREFKVFRLERILDRISTASSSALKADPLGSSYGEPFRKAILEMAPKSLSKRRFHLKNPVLPQYKAYMSVRMRILNLACTLSNHVRLAIEKAIRHYRVMKTACRTRCISLRDQAEKQIWKQLD